MPDDGFGQESRCYNLSMFSDVLLASLVKDCGYNPNRTLIVGISGGADSLAMLHCLAQASVKVVAAHFDHGLRPNSGTEAKKVAAMAKAWGLRCALGSQDVQQFAEREGLGIEEAARLCRYKFLFETARKRRAQAVVVAHQADDQVETILMHFLRGAGLNGLSGMQPVTYLRQLDAEIPIFRPMLGLFREDVLAYCREHELPYITDESNLDTNFFRNRLRSELIPYLETFNPAIRNLVRRNAQVIQSDRSILESLEQARFAECLQQEPEEGVLILKKNVLISLEKGWQRRMILRSVSTLKPDLRDFGFQRIERVLAALDEGRLGRMELPGVELLLSADQITFQLPGKPARVVGFPQLRGPEPASMTQSAPLALENGWKLHAALITNKAYRRLKPSILQDSRHGFLNPADLEWPLVVRPRRDGESWSPLGMGLRHQKLSDFLINNKIPQAARAFWPLVCSGGSLIWVAGLRIAQPWRLLGDEPQVLHLWLTSPEGD